MCGLFAITSSRSDVTICPRATCRLATAQVSRGHHAWGIAWVDLNYTIRSFRAVGPITDHLESLAYIAETATAMIGHTRWATHGAASDLACAHPFTCDGGFLAHNGIIPHHERIAAEHGLLTTSECDSEVLARLVENGSSDMFVNVGKSFANAINATDANAPLATIALFRKTLVFARRGNPLHRTTVKHNGATLTLIGSNPYDSRLSAPAVADNTVHVVSLFTNRRAQTTKLVAPKALRTNVVGSSLFR
jgi:glucosamine--fructose-6-phosphate aminotransferase (isomerizing)